MNITVSTLQASEIWGVSRRTARIRLTNIAIGTTTESRTVDGFVKQQRTVNVISYIVPKDKFDRFTAKPKAPTKLKSGTVLHFVKSGSGWSAVAACGRRFPRLLEGTTDKARFLAGEVEHTCDKCRAALAKAEEKKGKR